MGHDWESVLDGDVEEVERNQRMGKLRAGSWATLALFVLLPLEGYAWYGLRGDVFVILMLFAEVAAAVALVFLGQAVGAFGRAGAPTLTSLATVSIVGLAGATGLMGLLALAGGPSLLVVVGAARFALQCAAFGLLAILPFFARPRVGLLRPIAAVLLLGLSALFCFLGALVFVADGVRAASEHREIGEYLLMCATTEVLGLFLVGSCFRVMRKRLETNEHESY